jgi:hypothetical protein
VILLSKTLVDPSVTTVSHTKQTSLLNRNLILRSVVAASREKILGRFFPATALRSS